MMVNFDQCWERSLYTEQFSWANDSSFGFNSGLHIGYWINTTVFWALSIRVFRCHCFHSFLYFQSNLTYHFGCPNSNQSQFHFCCFIKLIITLSLIIPLLLPFHYKSQQFRHLIIFQYFGFFQSHSYDSNRF